MNRNAILEHIIQREGGRRPVVYTDTKGHPTVGVGFNLDRSDARAKISALGLDYDKVRSGTQSLDTNQIDTLLNADIDQAIHDARNLVANFDTIPDDKQVVVADMVFNLGAGSFGRFTDTIDAIEKEDWDAAATAMEDSKWFDQVKSRGVIDVNLMRGGPDQGS